MKPKNPAEALQYGQSLIAQLRVLAKQHEQVLEAYEARLEAWQADAAKNPAGVAGKRPAPVLAVEGPDFKRHRLLNEREARRRAIWDECWRIVEKCRRHSKADPFKQPVDPIKLKIPDYYNIIKYPMDLATVATKIKRGDYQAPREFAHDMRAIWANCRTYNPAGTLVAKMGETMSEYWERNWGTSNIEQRWAMELAQEAHEEKVLAGDASDAPSGELPGRLRDMRAALGDLIAARDHLDGIPPGTLPPPAEGRVMTFEERRRLSAHLCSLPGEKLQAVVDIVAADMAIDKEAMDEIEITLDELSNNTLWRLREYVDSALAPQGPPPKKGGAHRGSTPGGPPDKRPATKGAAAVSGGGPAAPLRQPAAPAAPPAGARVVEASPAGSLEALGGEGEEGEEGSLGGAGVVGSTAVFADSQRPGPPVFADTGTVAQSGTNRAAASTFIKPKTKADGAKADGANQVDADKWAADLGGADGGAGAEGPEAAGARAAAATNSGGGDAANGGGGGGGGDGDDDLWSDWQKKAAKEEEKLQRQKEEEARRKAEEEENKRKLEELEQQQELERQEALDAEKAAQRAELESMRNRAGLAEDGGACVSDLGGGAGGGGGGESDGGGASGTGSEGGGGKEGNEADVSGVPLRAKQDDEDEVGLDTL